MVATREFALTSNLVTLSSLESHMPKLRKNPATLTRGGRTKVLKNLGWLFSHWKDVKNLEFRFIPGNKMVDGELIAHLDDGGIYRTDYASYGVARDILDRPVFEGLSLTTIRGDDRTTETIGSTAYRAKKNPKRRCRLRKNPFTRSDAEKLLNGLLAKSIGTKNWGTFTGAAKHMKSGNWKIGVEYPSGSRFYWVVPPTGKIRGTHTF
jgi:hypothetical protein